MIVLISSFSKPSSFYFGRKPQSDHKVKVYFCWQQPFKSTSRYMFWEMDEKESSAMLHSEMRFDNATKPCHNFTFITITLAII